MASNYPGTLDAFSNPSGAATLAAAGHAALHGEERDAIENIETTVGTTAGTNVLKNFVAGDFPVRINASNVMQQAVSGTINNSTLGTPAITGGTATSQTFAGTPVLDSTSSIPFYNDSMSRQAIINGNFDVWQRLTTKTNPANNEYVTDRFAIVIDADGGTPPTNIIHSRQLLTTGDLANSFYHYRIAPDGAGSGFGTNSYYGLVQRIEHGNRLLCGLNKTITVSFYARSSIANKKIGIYLEQNYGTGGSPSSAENITGDKWTLTSTWTKYTKTFTTNTLVGKTFGTDNNDTLILWFQTQWGATRGARVNDSGVAESHVGSGNIDIAQVQVCSGDVAFPFQPKSYEEELRNCKRYCYVIEPTTANGTIMWGHSVTTTAVRGNIHLDTFMRIVPSLTVIGTFQVALDGGGSTTCTSIVIADAATTSHFAPDLQFNVAAGLTANRFYQCRNESGGKLIFDAEL